MTASHAASRMTRFWTVQYTVERTKRSVHSAHRIERAAARAHSAGSAPPMTAARASQVRERPTVFCRLGRFQRATVTTCHNGHYLVRFQHDGATCWRVASELAITASPPDRRQLARLEPGAAILLLASDGTSSYLHGSFLKHSGKVRAEVQMFSATSSSPAITVDTADLRLPMAAGVMLGESVRLVPGRDVHALCGSWYRATVDRVSATLGWHVTLDVQEGKLQIWLDGGQIVAPCSIAAEYMALGSWPKLETGSRVFAPGSSKDLEDAEIVSASDTHAEVRLARGGTSTIQSDQIHVRLQESLRCLSATGGFQRGVVKEVKLADGLFRVSLFGDAGERWVSAAEIATDTCLLDASQPACAAGTVAALLPKTSTQRVARWLPAIRCVTDSLLNGTRLQRFQRLTGQRELTVRVTRKGGRFGMGHDEHNQLVTVHSESAAADAGLRVGDIVRSVDDEPLTGLLTAALQGKESVQLEVTPEDAEIEGEWLVERERILLVALDRQVAIGKPINVGDECYVLTGGWCEAMVTQRRADGLSTIDFGERTRRLAHCGELAWHDTSPMVRDVWDGLSFLGWHDLGGTFQSCIIVRKAASRVRGSDTWVVRFEDGIERLLSRDLLRARWAAPLRLMALWGDYYAATVVDVLANRVLRLDFGAGDIRWALNDELLQEFAPHADDLRSGMFVACELAHEDHTVAQGFRRALLLSRNNTSCEVLFEDGQKVCVASAVMRLPRVERSHQPKVGQTVYALFGQWCAATVVQPAKQTFGRVSAVILGSDGTSWQTTLGVHDVVALDGGSVWQGSFRMGTPLVVRARSDSKNEWESAVFISHSSETGLALVVLSDGTELNALLCNLRPRLGAVHPLELALQQSNIRAEHHRQRSAAIVHRFVRNARSSRDAAGPHQVKQPQHAAATGLQQPVERRHAMYQLKHASRAATLLQAVERGHTARLHVAQIQEEGQRQSAAVMIQAGCRAHIVRGFVRMERALMSPKATALRQGAAIVIQARARCETAKAVVSELRAHLQQEQLAAEAAAAKAAEEERLTAEAAAAVTAEEERLAAEAKAKAKADAEMEARLAAEAAAGKLEQERLAAEAKAAAAAVAAEAERLAAKAAAAAKAEEERLAAEAAAAAKVDEERLAAEAAAAAKVDEERLAAEAAATAKVEEERLAAEAAATAKAEEERLAAEAAAAAKAEEERLAAEAAAAATAAEERLAAEAAAAAQVEKQRLAAEAMAKARAAEEQLLAAEAMAKARAAEEERLAAEARQGAISILQAGGRGMLARRSAVARRDERLLALQRAAAVIQAHQRTRSTKQWFHRTVLAAVRVQAGLRMSAARAEARQLASEQALVKAAQTTAAIQIQAMARGHAVSRKRAHEIVSAVRLQTRARGRQAQNTLQHLRGARHAQDMQTAAAERLARQHSAAVWIQNRLRTRLALIQYHDTLDAVIVLQSGIRRQLGRSVLQQRVREAAEATASERAVAMLAAAGKAAELRRFLGEELSNLEAIVTERTMLRPADRTVLCPPISHAKGCSFVVRVDRKQGKFGMGHDEHNCIVVVHPKSAADDAGLHVGDFVSFVDGKPLTGLLTASLAGKEGVELRLLRPPVEPFEWCDLYKLRSNLIGSGRL